MFKIKINLVYAVSLDLRFLSRKIRVVRWSDLGIDYRMGFGFHTTFKLVTNLR